MLGKLRCGMKLKVPIVEFGAFVDLGGIDGLVPDSSFLGTR